MGGQSIEGRKSDSGKTGEKDESGWEGKKRKKIAFREGRSRDHKKDRSKEKKTRSRQFDMTIKSRLNQKIPDF